MNRTDQTGSYYPTCKPKVAIMAFQYARMMHSSPLICTPQTLAASRRRTFTRSTDANFHDANLYRSRATPKHRADWREDCTKVSALSALTCRREADTLCLPIGRWHVPSGLGEKFHADKRRFESRHCDCAVRQRAERRTVQLMRQVPSLTFVFENLRSSK